MNEEGRKFSFENIKQAGIEGIIAIGGDGTFTGAIFLIRNITSHLLEYLERLTMICMEQMKQLDMLQHLILQ